MELYSIFLGAMPIILGTKRSRDRNLFDVKSVLNWTQIDLAWIE